RPVLRIAEAGDGADSAIALEHVAGPAVVLVLRAVQRAPRAARIVDIAVTRFDDELDVFSQRDREQAPRLTHAGGVEVGREWGANGVARAEDRSGGREREPLKRCVVDVKPRRPRVQLGFRSWIAQGFFGEASGVWNHVRA